MIDKLDKKVESVFTGMRYAACQIGNRNFLTQEEFSYFLIMESDLYRMLLGVSVVGLGAVVALTTMMRSKT